MHLFMQRPKRNQMARFPLWNLFSINNKQLYDRMSPFGFCNEQVFCCVMVDLIQFVSKIIIFKWFDARDCSELTNVNKTCSVNSFHIAQQEKMQCSFTDKPLTNSPVSSDTKRDYRVSFSVTRERHFMYCTVNLE